MSSAWKQNIKKKYDEHKHCSVCGISIPSDKDFCGIECKDKYSSYEKKKNKTNYSQMFFMIIPMIVLMIMMQFM
ncbi:MAG: DUF2116 family Zn-ribbon domain-containing protein [archaeon]|nr:DUF2116 family Zn-ribbon domain-containing protein [archaeon]